MDQTYLPEASARGARIFSGVRATRVRLDGHRATGVYAHAEGGATLQIEAKRAVVLAASAIQTPLLLLASGLRQGPVGQRFQCHPGVSIAGRFAEPMKLWTGATQGHEVTGLRRDGLKLEVLGYDMAVAAGRLKSIGAGLSRDIGELDHWANWGAAIRARTFGRVTRGLTGRPHVSFSLGEADLRLVRRGVRALGEVMLAAGAQYVTPGVHGWHEKVSDPAVMARFEDEGPRDARAYMMAVTHLFGTARMGSDPRISVVRPDFRHHAAERLYVADSSIFPTNIGVNPQTSILALATLCGRRIVAGV